MNPVLIDLGFMQIRWYSVLILIACFVVLFLTQNEAERFGVQREFIFNMLFWALIMGIIGARLYYVIFNIQDYIKNPIEILKVWNGGLAIHGGLIFGFLTILFYCKKYKVRVVRILDFLVVPLLLGQAIGRWGNFFNSEAYGQVTTLEALKNIHLPKFIINGMYINGYYREPTFLYESFFSFIGFIVMICIRKVKKLKVGQLTSLYLIWYGIERFIIEFKRSDSLMLGSIKVAQLVSSLALIIGILLFIKSIKHKDYQSAKF